ncbi:MAG: LysM peptidoglycan-binding domain-containing protein [Firmicutes bacterium]|nr:LysM peptidoglycan-binding domain-containing protein [Bacillota bacterium]
MVSLLLGLLTLMPLAQLPASAATTYRVVSGDTLWKLSARFQVSTSQIIQANPQLKSPYWLYVGQTLTIPDKSSPTISAFEQQVIDLTNAERKKAGLSPLKANTALCKVARLKSEDMRNNNYFSHSSPTYGSPFNMMRKYGISYTMAGENIAAGYSSPQEVVKAWMKSPGHRQNILNPSYNQIGVGYAAGGSYRSYWTQEFIRS